MELLKKWLGHPEELYNLVRFKMGGYKTVMPKMEQAVHFISPAYSYNDVLLFLLYNLTGIWKPESQKKCTLHMLDDQWNKPLPLA
ncbi:hypothetical protein JD844_025735 [Phrynosoma platyrhinos]|uniref:Hexosyltransferase n=1 Tax=Phrynosoma platyrhinos TaxID=52577 RepID=A0ABQ7SZS3_PHRPL|nr:hypothetical protein JD844_025735 [Phrynosoma platyrhinos]